MPQSKPIRSGKEPPALGRDSLPEISSGNLPDNFAHNFDDNPALSSLKELIASGDLLLDPMLAAITDAALQMTGASGAALAMWKEGAMVCRARSGTTAPVLGARLSTDTGISGECLRTGKIQHCSDTENDPLVDVEVCRTLGLRSIAVFPIRGWRAINGILEVFATRQAAFAEGHLALLQQLALLAERARASQPYGASPAVPQPLDAAAVAKPQSSGVLPASDRVGDVAFAAMGARSRPVVLGAIGIVVLSLLALVIWLGWRGSDDADNKSRREAPTSVATTVNAATVNATTPRAPETDPVWKANPGGESVVLSVGKDSTGTPVKLASKVEGTSGKKTPVRSWADQPFLLSDVAADTTTQHGSFKCDGTFTQGRALRRCAGRRTAVDACRLDKSIGSQWSSFREGFVAGVLCAGIARCFGRPASTSCSTGLSRSGQGTAA